MKHVTLHDYLATFTEAEEPYPVVAPEEGHFDKDVSDGIDATNNPRMSKFDVVEVFNQMPSSGFANEPIPLDNLDTTIESTSDSATSNEVNPGA